MILTIADSAMALSRAARFGRVALYQTTYQHPEGKQREIRSQPYCRYEELIGFQVPQLEPELIEIVN